MAGISETGEDLGDAGVALELEGEEEVVFVVDGVGLGGWGWRGGDLRWGRGGGEEVG